jgi:long-chain acyl-CoA synthetase
VAENVYALTDSQASVCSSTTLPRPSRATEGPDGQRRDVVYMGDGPTPPGMLSYEALVEQHCADARREPCQRRSYVIFYTGGTTAHPKGVAMSHKGVYLATCVISHCCRAWRT